jgi:hypothetical protein
MDLFRPLNFDIKFISLTRGHKWSKTTLNYRMTVERYPNLKEEVDGSIPGYEISSLLNGKLARWSPTSCASTLACRPSDSKKKKKQEVIKLINFTSPVTNLQREWVTRSVSDERNGQRVGTTTKLAYFMFEVWIYMILKHEVNSVLKIEALIWISLWSALKFQHCNWRAYLNLGRQWKLFKEI